MATPGPPSVVDLEEHALLLEGFLNEFSKKCPNLSDLLKGFVALDSHYRCKLSKATTKGAQKRWAEHDSVSIRYMLTYIFNSVRTSGGKSSARNPTICRLRSFVRTDAVMRCDCSKWPIVRSESSWGGNAF